jgi:hypothetical protein
MWNWVCPRAGLDKVVKRKFPVPAGKRTPIVQLADKSYELGY